MKRIAVIVSSPAHQNHEELATAAVSAVGSQLGIDVQVETSSLPNKRLTDAEIISADAVLIASDNPIDMSRFGGKSVYSTSTVEAIRHTKRVVESTLSLSSTGQKNSIASNISKEIERLAPEVVSTPAPISGGKKLVAITSCPTGIAHTFMAAQALQKAAASLGHEIKVETQGSVGSQDKLTSAEIAAADAVVIAADVNIDLSRFEGKRLYSTGTKDAMGHGPEVIEKALALPIPSKSDLNSKVDAAKAERSAQRTGPYKHLMTGVSYMLPLVVAGGLCIALAFAVGGINAGKAEGTLGAALSQIGGGTALSLFVAVFSAFIAYSIADRPGIAPGLVGGMLAKDLGAGFLGGIASGFLAGYLTAFLAKSIQLPRNLDGLKPVLILPFLSTLIVGLAMIYIIAPPVASVLAATTSFLNSMRGGNAALLGLLLGAMMAFDMGGPINKAAYTFSLGLLGNQVGGPIAAVMAAGMTPPLGLALAATLFPNRFDEEEIKARGTAFVLGLAFITEGAIPFAAKDPLRVIPSLMLGSGVAGAISMAAGVTSAVPHGGVFALIIPNTIAGLPIWILGIVAGTLTTTGALWVLKKPVTASSDVAVASSAA